MSQWPRLSRDSQMSDSKGIPSSSTSPTTTDSRKVDLHPLTPAVVDTKQGWLIGAPSYALTAMSWDTLPQNAGSQNKLGRTLTILIRRVNLKGRTWKREEAGMILTVKMKKLGILLSWLLMQAPHRQEKRALNRYNR